MIVSALITQAFLDMGAIAAGESITSDEQADAFLRLNQLLASWANEELLATVMLHTDFTPVAGTVNYTMGVGGDFTTTARPMRVTAAQSFSGGFRSSCKVLSHEQFAVEVSDPLSSTAKLATHVAADTGKVLINLKVFPVPSASPGTLTVSYWSPLTAFANVGATVDLPEGWEDALHFGLAVRLYPQYPRKGGMPPELAAQAQTSKATIMALKAATQGAPPKGDE